jgi:hypothetical protein
MSEPENPAPPPPQPQYGAYPGSYPPPPPQQPYPGQAVAPTAPKNGMGIASLVTAIIGLFTVFGGLLLGVVAIILGFIGWRRAKQGEATNGGVAIAGIVLGILGVIVSIVAIVLAVSFFNEVGGTDYIDCLSKAGSDQDAMQQCADQFQEHVEDQFSITLTPTS